jgi:hypothetical protein
MRDWVIYNGGMRDWGIYDGGMRDCRGGITMFSELLKIPDAADMI